MLFYFFCVSTRKFKISTVTHICNWIISLWGGTDLNTSPGSFLNSGLGTVPTRMVNGKKELGSCLKRGRFSPPSSSH